MATPKQTDPQFKLRMPLSVKEQIEAAAVQNNRSMNAEIVARLEESFDDSMFDTAMSQSRTLAEQGITIERQAETIRTQGEALRLVEDQNVELREKAAFQEGVIASLRENLDVFLRHLASPENAKHHDVLDAIIGDIKVMRGKD